MKITRKAFFRILAAFAIFAGAGFASGAERAVFKGFERGMGIGGWLTNYKRFNVLPDKWRMKITVGDMEHFRSYITEADVKNIADRPHKAWLRPNCGGGVALQVPRRDF